MRTGDSATISEWSTILLPNNVSYMRGLTVFMIQLHLFFTSLTLACFQSADYCMDYRMFTLMTKSSVQTVFTILKYFLWPFWQCDCLYILVYIIFKIIVLFLFIICINLKNQMIQTNISFRALDLLNVNARHPVIHLEYSCIYYLCWNIPKYGTNSCAFHCAEEQ